MTLQFRAQIHIIGVNPYVLVTAEQAAELKPDWRRPMPVLVQVNGQPVPPWPINMMPTGDGNFFCYLRGDVRKVTGTGVGDAVHITLSFHDNYVPGPADMPEPLRAALDAYPTAQANYDALPPSRQKEIVRYLLALKSPEAVQRNVERTLKALSGEPTHYLGRDWNDGR
jgi:hypothetical protein